MNSIGATVGAGSAAFLAALVMAAGPLMAGDCDNKLGVGRTVRIDTTGAPAFGFQHYKTYDFLKEKEVVLTFDDGPLPPNTEKVLKALANHCTRATFFTVGKLVIGYPEVLHKVKRGGHTIATHTWSHKNVRKQKWSKAKEHIEMAVSAVKVALGEPPAPFFRYPFLVDSRESIEHFAKRNIAIFSTDLDSFDFKGGSSKRMVARVMKNLKKKGKGILLFHDINKVTGNGLQRLLDQLHKNGFSIVHLTAKAPAVTLPEYDKKVEKLFKGTATATASRPLSSVVETVE